ncbi:MAG: hypothetical protein ACOVRN_19185 [Flavobacterium sp.]
MLTFDGVPVATYGLTGLMLAFLTGMTFIDTKGEADTPMTAVATASVPAFMGTMLTPSAPSFVDSLTQSANDLIQPEEPSLLSKMTGPSEEPSFMDKLTGPSEEPSFMDKLTGPSEEPSFMDKLTGPSEEPSLIDKLTAPLIDKSPENESMMPDFLKRGGGKKKNKGKKTRKFNNKRTN